DSVTKIERLSMCRLSAVGVLLTMCSATLAQVPQPKIEEILPLPRQLQMQMQPHPGNLLIVGPPPPPAMPQFGTRDVWQYYGVDSAGRFRPRVVATPQGAYYMVNGVPYPWTTTRPMLYMPYVVD